jgi:hypothetical protein
MSGSKEENTINRRAAGLSVNRYQLTIDTSKGYGRRLLIAGCQLGPNMGIDPI